MDGMDEDKVVDVNFDGFKVKARAPEHQFGTTKTIECDVLSDETLARMGVECDNRGHYSFVKHVPSDYPIYVRTEKIVKLYADDRYCMKCGVVREVQNRNFQHEVTHFMGEKQVKCQSTEGLDCGHTVLITRETDCDGKFLWWSLSYKDTIKKGA